MLRAALLVKLNLPACGLWPKILDLHAQRCGDPGEGMGEGNDERTVAQGFGRNALDERAPLVAIEDGVLPVFTTCLGPRRAAAGFNGTIWPVISQSNSIRTAASCCFTSGAECIC